MFDYGPRATSWNIEGFETHPKVVPWRIEIEFLCGHGSSSVVKSHTRPSSQVNAISLPFHSCGPFYTMSYNNSSVVRLCSFIPKRALYFIFSMC